MNAFMTFLRGSWSIAVYTWREGIRKKTLIGFLILSILVIFGSFFLTAFMQNATVGAETDVETKLIKDISVTAISIFGVLIAIFTSASVVPTEVDNRVVYTILSKPVRRYQYLFGKFLGIQLIVLLNLVLMGGLFFIAIWFKEQIMPTLLLWFLLLTFFEFLVVSALTFAVSAAASSSVLPTIAGLFIYLVGNLTPYLKDVYERAGQRQDEWIGNIAWALYQVLPNLQNFSIKNQILLLPVNDPPKDVQIPMLIAYGLVYGLGGYILAYWVFRRREL